MVSDEELRLLRTLIWNESHVLRYLFPEKVQKHYKGTSRPHDFKLPGKDDKNYTYIMYQEYYRPINTNSIGQAIQPSVN